MRNLRRMSHFLCKSGSGAPYLKKSKLRASSPNVVNLVKANKPLLKFLTCFKVNCAMNDPQSYFRSSVKRNSRLICFSLLYWVINLKKLALFSPINEKQSQEQSCLARTDFPARGANCHWFVLLFTFITIDVLTLKWIGHIFHGATVSYIVTLAWLDKLQSEAQYAPILIGYNMKEWRCN